MKNAILSLSILFLSSFSGIERDIVTIQAGEQIQIEETIISLNQTT